MSTRHKAVMIAVGLGLVVAVAMAPRLGMGAAAVLGGAALLAVLAAMDVTLGVCLLLCLMPFDHFTVQPLLVAIGGYPPAFHIVDAVAVGLVIGYCVRRLLRKTDVRWRWYDALYLVFLIALGFSAVHGFAVHNRYVLREARVIPWLASYFPAREALSRFRKSRDQVYQALLLYGIIYCAVAFVSAWAQRMVCARTTDIILPRLPFVADVIPLLIIPLVAWEALVVGERKQLRALGVIALLLCGSALAISNTRTYWLGFLVAGLTFGLLCLCRRDLAPRRASGLMGMGILLVGISIPYVVQSSGLIAPKDASDYVYEANPQLRPKEWHPPAPRRTVAAPELRVKTLAEGTDENLINRSRESRSAVQDISSSPLIGVGMGAPIEFTELHWTGKNVRVSYSWVHSAYLAVCRQGGLAGLLALLALLGTVVITSTQASRNSAHLGSVFGLPFVLAALPMMQFVNIVLVASSPWFAFTCAVLSDNCDRQPTPAMEPMAELGDRTASPAASAASHPSGQGPCH